MTIPASYVVDVQPRVITGGSNDLEFNGLFLTNNEIISADTMVLEFNSAASVGAYFGIASEEYFVAESYFPGYDNKFVAPRSIFFARRIDGLIAAWVRSAPNNKTLSQYQAITDGSINVSIDGTSYSYTGINLSNATSFSDVADIIAATFDDDPDGPSVSLTFSSLNNRFKLESLMLGASSEVEYPSDGTTGTGLATFMNFTQEQGAIHSGGSTALDETEQMEAIRAHTENFVTFTTMWEPTVEESLAWGRWATAHYGWLYIGWTTSPLAVLQDSAIDLAPQIVDNNLAYAKPLYGDLRFSAAYLGFIACIPWTRTNGAVTLAFKKQAGLAANVLTESEARVLNAKGYDYMGRFASRNAEFTFNYDSKLPASDYGFVDPYLNSVWLNNRLQVAILDGLTLTGRAPYNERGYALIRAWMTDPINEALNNGVIEPGITLTEAQKSQLFNEAGQDISEELQSQGYFLQITDPGGPIRAQRQSPIINLWYMYGGAIHRIEVASTAIL